MEATKLLKDQHDEVKALLEKVLESSGSEGAKLLEEITRNLLAHMVIEQEIFYPAASRIDLPHIEEGYEEHFLVREMVNRALRASKDKDLFQARCKVLKDVFEHHVEEEESEMFPNVEYEMESEALEELGARMEPLFEDLKTLSLPALARRAERIEVLSALPAPRPVAKRRPKAAVRARKPSGARRKQTKGRKRATR